MRHTKGPWVLVPGAVVLTPEGLIDCQFMSDDGREGRRSDENEYCNASLIAAAPEMLEVLDLIHAELILNGEYKDEELFTKIEVVLKKARG